MKRIFCGIVLTVILFPGFVSGAIPASERAALLALYNSTNGDQWWTNDGWRTPPLHTDGFAVPGTVMGIGYILFFNSPPLKLTGTFIILIINEAFRNLSVSLEAGVGKLHQIDIAIEEAAIDMGASSFRTFTRVVLPLISSALAAGFVYTFMVGMIAVSAVIFLITPGNNLASLYILAVAEEGFLGMACAISVMLIAVVMICLGGLKLLAHYTKTIIF